MSAGVPAAVSDSFRLATGRRSPSPDLSRPDPPLPAIFAREAAAIPPFTSAGPGTERKEQESNLRRLPSFGLAGSLALHLLPLLMLVNWASSPPELAEMIPVQLVIEPPSPAPPSPPSPTPPPRNRIASDDIGPSIDKTAKAAPPAPEHAPELKTALAAPASPPEPLPIPEAPLEPSPPAKPKPSPKAATQQPDKVLHLAGPSGWQVLGDQVATRDEYLGLLKALTQRHMNLLPLSVIAGRRGDTYLSILVLGDGTIARIAITRSSGYPDIDERVEQMVSAVGRFPPIPTRFGTSSMELVMHLRFPEGTAR